MQVSAQEASDCRSKLARDMLELGNIVSVKTGHVSKAANTMKAIMSLHTTDRTAGVTATMALAIIAKLTVMLCRWRCRKPLKDTASGSSVRKRNVAKRAVSGEGFASLALDTFPSLSLPLDYHTDSRRARRCCILLPIYA